MREGKKDLRSGWASLGMTGRKLHAFRQTVRDCRSVWLHVRGRGLSPRRHGSRQTAGVFRVASRHRFAMPGMSGSCSLSDFLIPSTPTALSSSSVRRPAAAPRRVSACPLSRGRVLFFLFSSRFAEDRWQGMERTKRWSLNCVPTCCWFGWGRTIPLAPSRGTNTSLVGIQPGSPSIKAGVAVRYLSGGLLCDRGGST